MSRAASFHRLCARCRDSCSISTRTRACRARASNSVSGAFSLVPSSPSCGSSTSNVPASVLSSETTSRCGGTSTSCSRDPRASSGLNVPCSKALSCSHSRSKLVSVALMVASRNASTSSSSSILNSSGMLWRKVLRTWVIYLRSRPSWRTTVLYLSALFSRSINSVKVSRSLYIACTTAFGLNASSFTQGCCSMNFLKAGSNEGPAGNGFSRSTKSTSATRFSKGTRFFFRVSILLLLA
mmetsp:Transcript_100567/g.199781  ORF Transcript_100567/g.199781 Transcript_100567/m.199781 type:complete len:239 (-) Transcript_100567:2000-2716(-)